MVASMVVEGSMTQELFIEYLEFTVVFHNHNSTIITDPLFIY